MRSVILATTGSNRAYNFAPVSAPKRFESTPCWVYGQSYWQQPGAFCTSGYEAHNRVRTRLAMPSVTDYAVGSSRAIEIATDLIGQAAQLPTTGSTWTGARKGLVLIGLELNDDINTDGVSTAQALSALQVTNFGQAVQTALTVLASATRVEVEAGTLSGTAATLSATNTYSGAALVQLKAQGDSVSVPITVPAGVTSLQLLQWLASSAIGSGVGNGAYSISVDGTVVATDTAGVKFSQIKSKRGSGQVFNVGPAIVQIPVTAGATHTIVITKTDSGAGYVYPDAIFTPSLAPVPVILMKDPLPGYPGLATTPNSATSASNRPIVVANQALTHPVIDSIAALFPNVHVHDLAYLNGTSTASAGLSLVDQMHPSDIGMEIIADQLTPVTATVIAAHPLGAYTTV